MTPNKNVDRSHRVPDPPKSVPRPCRASAVGRRRPEKPRIAKLHLLAVPAGTLRLESPPPLAQCQSDDVPVPAGRWNRDDPTQEQIVARRRLVRAGTYHLVAVSAIGALWDRQRKLPYLGQAAGADLGADRIGFVHASGLLEHLDGPVVLLLCECRLVHVRVGLR